MSIFDDRPCQLGEGALWHPLRRQFFWFDILNGLLMTREGDRPREWRIGRMASAAGWIDEDRLLIGTETGLAILTLSTGAMEEVAAIEAEDAGTRSNDGRADRQGGFWLGFMGKSGEAGRGAIYRWHRGEVRRLVDGIAVPNAICFSPDGRTAHWTDSHQGMIWRQPLDADGWPQGEAVPFIDAAAQGLEPDGAVIDAEGALLVACWGAGKVVRFGADGTRLDEITVPGLHSSCPALGGPDLRRLLVTTARQARDPAGPDDGPTYIFDAPAPGLPEPQVRL